MEHKLHVLVRLDADLAAAVLQVSGCLTAESCQALPNIIQKAAALLHRDRITVDLTRARHIEREAVAFLRSGTGFGKSELFVKCPDLLPQCPAPKTPPRSHQASQELFPAHRPSALSWMDLPSDPLDTEALEALPQHTLQALTDRVFHQLDSDHPSAFALEWYSALCGEWARRTGPGAGQSTTKIYDHEYP